MLLPTANKTRQASSACYNWDLRRPRRPVVVVLRPKRSQWTGICHQRLCKGVNHRWALEAVTREAIRRIKPIRVHTISHGSPIRSRRLSTTALLRLGGVWPSIRPGGYVESPQDFVRTDARGLEIFSSYMMAIGTRRARQKRERERDRPDDLAVSSLELSCQQVESSSLRS